MTAQELIKLAVFEGKEIRRTLHNGDWWFAVADVVAALTDSADTRQYIKRMRQREPELESNWGTICTPLELKAPDGKMRKTNCAKVEGLLRIIQSIPSPKAEPFKRWLARVGAERLAEIEDPELAMARMKALYEKKGYTKSWIDKRLRGMAVRHDLTDEWQQGWVNFGRRLTNGIYGGGGYQGITGLEFVGSKANGKSDNKMCHKQMR